MKQIRDAKRLRSQLAKQQNELRNTSESNPSRMKQQIKSRPFLPAANGYEKGPLLESMQRSELSGGECILPLIPIDSIRILDHNDKELPKMECDEIAALP